jgi:hypothetical protein
VSFFEGLLVRKLIFAAIALCYVAFPAVADAQGRGEGQGRQRAQQQQKQQRRDAGPSGFSGMLNDIAGARLNRAHAGRRSDRPQQGGGKNGRGRGGW